MKNVAVTNGNEDSYVRRWDGKNFEFPPGKEVVISEDAAAYLFAYGKDDSARRKLVIRNGWQRSSMADDAYGPVKALERLRRFVFKEAPDDPVRPKPEKKLAPATLELKRRQPGEDAIVAPGTPEQQVIGGRPTLHLPGKKAPLAPPAAA